MSNQTDEIWWAGYLTQGAIFLLTIAWQGKEGTIRMVANWPSPAITVPIAIGILWYANRGTRKAEKEIRANTVELIAPSPGYHRWKKRQR